MADTEWTCISAAGSPPREWYVNVTSRPIAERGMSSGHFAIIQLKTGAFLISL